MLHARPRSWRVLCVTPAGLASTPRARSWKFGAREIGAQISAPRMRAKLAVISTTTLAARPCSAHVREAGATGAAWSTSSPVLRARARSCCGAWGVGAAGAGAPRMCAKLEIVGGERAPGPQCSAHVREARLRSRYFCSWRPVLRARARSWSQEQREVAAFNGARRTRTKLGPCAVPPHPGCSVLRARARSRPSAIRSASGRPSAPRMCAKPVLNGDPLKISPSALLARTRSRPALIPVPRVQQVSQQCRERARSWSRETASASPSTSTLRSCAGTAAAPARRIGCSGPRWLEGQTARARSSTRGDCWRTPKVPLAAYCPDKARPASYRAPSAARRPCGGDHATAAGRRHNEGDEQWQ